MRNARVTVPGRQPARAPLSARLYGVGVVTDEHNSADRKPGQRVTRLAVQSGTV